MSTQNSTHAAVAALRLYEAAYENLFAQCCSNPIKNAWGKEVNLAKLNIAHEAAGRALNASPALEAPAAPPVPVDDFRGDTPSLVRNIVALLELDADGALVPHGVGGHARGLLSAAAARLAAAPQVPNCSRCSGSGEDPEGYLTHGRGPDDHTVDGPCRSCEGTGAAPQAPAAPAEPVTQVIDSLLSMARIVNVAVEDWGETKEDDSLHVIFHKEQADKLEEILDFFDTLPDASPEEGVILSGPSRAARVLRAMAAPAAPAVDALSQAARDVLAERRRQVEAEGYDTEHDDAHVMGEIGALAALYLMPDGARDWDTTSTTYGATLGQALLPEDWTMPTMGEDRRRDLVKGIACGLAELERWDRASAQTNGGNAT